MTLIVGQAVILREFREDDAAGVANIIADDRVTYWLSFDSRSGQAAEKMIETTLARAASQPRVEYYLAIAQAGDDSLVGFIRLALTGVRAAKLGYAIRAEDWSKGYGSEAVRLMLDFAFKSLEFHRVTAAIGPDNVRSVSLVEKFAFKYEGRLRDHVFTNGSWRDSLLYSILQGEWAGHV